MIIDAHMHVGTWAHADFLGRATTVADAVQVLQQSGFDGGAMSPTDQCDNAGLLEEMRAALAGGYNGRLWFMPWVRPSTDDLSWVCAHAAVVTGIKLHPSLSRTRISADGFAPVLTEADARGWVVNVHCGRWQEMASYRFAVEAALRYPGARFLLAHGGGDTPPLATAAAELVRSCGATNVWFDICGVREYWVLERNIALLGADRFLLASDYNLAHPLTYLGTVRGLSLDQEARARVLGGNAQDLFGVPLAL